MASKKELLQAQKWSRRRLLTAFTSGAPGGREVEPATPTRGIVAGAALAAVVLGGSYVGGLFNKGLPDGWDNGRIVLVADNAARYVSVEGVLVPVPNMATARLLVPKEAPIITVSADDLADVPRAPQVGIMGAPDSLTAPAALVPDAWRACLADGGGNAVEIARTDPQASEPSQASPDLRSVLVSIADQPDGTSSLHLVVGETRYPLPAIAEIVGLLRSLDLGPEDARPVDAAWLGLFPEGAQVTPFEVPGAGGTPVGDLGALGVVTGSVLEVGTNTYLALEDGRLAPLSPFADAVYSIGPGGQLERTVVTPAQVASVPEVDAASSPVPASWPTQLPEPLTTAESACARLDAAGFATRLEPGPTGLDAGVWVQPGAGAVAAFVPTADTAAGPVRYVDESGFAYPVSQSVGGDVAEALARLLGPDVVPAVVPYAWGNLFPSGPELSIDAAGLPIAVRVAADGS